VRLPIRKTPRNHENFAFTGLRIRGGLPQYPARSGHPIEPAGDVPAVTTATRLAPGAAAPDERERSLFSTMLRLRRFEEKAGMLYRWARSAHPVRWASVVRATIDGHRCDHPSSDVVLALRSLLPALELALGTAAGTAVFSVFAANAADDEPGTVPCPIAGRRAARLSREASARRSWRSGRKPSVPIATSADDLAAALRNLPNRVLPLLIVSTDRKPETWSHLAPLSVRECDGADPWVCAKHLQPCAKNWSRDIPERPWLF